MIRKTAVDNKRYRLHASSEITLFFFVVGKASSSSVVIGSTDAVAVGPLGTSALAFPFRFVEERVHLPWEVVDAAAAASPEIGAGAVGRLLRGLLRGLLFGVGVDGPATPSSVVDFLGTGPSSGSRLSRSWRINGEELIQHQHRK
jgi:hypothetical protein